MQRDRRPDPRPLSPRRRRVLQVALGLLLSPLAVAAVDCVDAPIDATFIQPSEVDLQRSRWEWWRLLQASRSLGMRTLYLQWSAWGEFDFSRARLPRGEPFVATLLSLAAELDMRLHLGLAADPAFGTQLALPAVQLAPYLAGLRRRSLDMAHALAPLAGASPAFAGWYLPEEIDDLHWRGAARSALLREHLSTQQRQLEEVLPGGAVSISAYLSGQPAAHEFIDLWTELWQQIPLRLLLQDGAGVHRLTAPQWLARARPLAQQAVTLRRDLSVVVELFEQRSGPPLDTDDFSAVPTNLSRLVAQLARTQGLPTTELVSFAAVNYLLDDRSPRAGALYEAYRVAYCSP